MCLGTQVFPFTTGSFTRRFGSLGPTASSLQKPVAAQLAARGPWGAAEVCPKNSRSAVHVHWPLVGTVVPQIFVSRISRVKCEQSEWRLLKETCGMNERSVEGSPLQHQA